MLNSTPESDEDLQAQFVPLLTAHHDQLLRYIYSLVGNWQDAQDVLQRTSLILWRKFDQFDPETSFLSWANRVAFYESKNFLRTSARDRHTFSDELLEKIAEERGSHLEVDSSRQISALKQCLKKLNAKDNDLLRRVYQDREAVVQLSAESGNAVQTIYNQLFRLRRKLQKCVEVTMQNQEGGA
jgi:RNA polymerase sigma-70 factor (ECF subfamily)